MFVSDWFYCQKFSLKSLFFIIRCLLKRVISWIGQAWRRNNNVLHGVISQQLVRSHVKSNTQYVHYLWTKSCVSILCDTVILYAMMFVSALQVLSRLHHNNSFVIPPLPSAEVMWKCPILLSPVHLILAVENCGLCMKRSIACCNYQHLK